MNMYLYTNIYIYIYVHITSLLQVVHRHGKKKRLFIWHYKNKKYVLKSAVVFLFYIGERTPVRKRLTQLFPAVWNMCDANAHMFATILSLDPKAAKQFVPLQRLVDEERLGQKPHLHKPGAW